MTEATLTKGIRELIHRRGGWARKAHGGPQMAGWPDLVCVYRGYPVMLEVKLPGKEGTLTKLQTETLLSIRKAGGIALMVTSKQQVSNLLDKIDQKKDRKKGK